MEIRYATGFLMYIGPKDPFFKFQGVLSFYQIQ